MSWHFSQAQVEAFSALGVSHESCVRLRKIRTAERSYCGGKKRASSSRSRSGTTLEPSTANRGVELWISSLRASRASRSRLPASEKGPMTSGTCGPTPFAYWEGFGRRSCCSRMCQGSLLADTSPVSSRDWPRSGTWDSGGLYPRQPWAPRISGNGSGSPPPFPTPTAGDAKASGSAGYSTESGRHSGTTLTDAVVRWPTPTQMTRDGTGMENRGKCNLEEVVGGQLNPTWVEWLMGFPIGWTALEPLEMHRFRQWSDAFMD